MTQSNEVKESGTTGKVYVGHDWQQIYAEVLDMLMEKEVVSGNLHELIEDIEAKHRIETPVTESKNALDHLGHEGWSVARPSGGSYSGRITLDTAPTGGDNVVRAYVSVGSYGLLVNHVVTDDYPLSLRCKSCGVDNLEVYPFTG